MEKVSVSNTTMQCIQVSAAGAESYIKDDIESGAAEFWKHGESYAVTRLEVKPDKGRELVLVCLEGKKAKELCQLLLDMVQQHPLITSIRFHTSNPAIARYFRKVTGLNPVEIERVYEAKVNG